jgi:hypothetical protein
MDSTDISMPITKAATAITAATAANTDVAEHVANVAAANASYSTWVFVNSVPWSQIAAMVAAAYTMLLIAEWFWKKLWRPILEARGWIKPKPHRIMTLAEYKEAISDE